MPKIALTTGGSDALECFLREIGIADSEFTTDAGTGRINLYVGGDASGNGAGANQFTAALGGTNFPNATTLWSSPDQAAHLRHPDPLLRGWYLPEHQAALLRQHQTLRRRRRAPLQRSRPLPMADERPGTLAHHRQLQRRWGQAAQPGHGDHRHHLPQGRGLQQLAHERRRHHHVGIDRSSPAVSTRWSRRPRRPSSGFTCRTIPRIRTTRRRRST